MQMAFQRIRRLQGYSSNQLEAPYAPYSKLTKMSLKYTVGVIFFFHNHKY